MRTSLLLAGVTNLPFICPSIPTQHPRDVYLFASDVGLGQRAMLAARGGAILFRTVRRRTR